MRKGILNKLQSGTLLPVILILIFGFAVYIQTVSFEIVRLDDSRYILDNYIFNKDFSNIFTAFSKDINYPSGLSVYYRPIQAISHIIDAQFGGTDPAFYHFTNILIHVAVSVTLFVLLLHLGYSRIPSFLCAIFFVVHPINVGAVAWIPGRIDSLLALFTLLSFIFLIKFLESKNWKPFIGHLLFFGFTLFTKETAVIIPVLFILSLIIFKERIFAASHYILAVSWVVVIVVWTFFRNNALGNASHLPLSAIIQAVTANIKATLLYLGKMLFPFNLSVLPILKDASLVFGYSTILVLIIAIALSKKRRYTYIFFGAMWFFLFLLPSFFTDDPTSIAIFMEHRAYIPLIGFIIILLEIDFLKYLDVRNKKILAPVVIVLLFFAWTAFSHSAHFSTSLSFWGNAAQTSPYLPKAYNGLGISYYDLGDIEKAEEAYKKAIELSPNEWLVHNNLGLLYMEHGRFENAEEEFLLESRNNPLNTGVLVNLGVLYYSHLGKTEKAHDMWEQAIYINKNDITAHEYLAIYYFQKERNIEKTIYHIQEVLKRGGTPQKGLLEVLNEYNKTYGIN